jgi:hypothetical protein
VQTVSFSLTNGVVLFDVENATALPELAASLRAFLTPYFWQVEGSEPHFRLIFRDFADLPVTWRERAVQHVPIRKSSAASFNLQGVGFEPDDDSLVVIDDNTRTAYHITYASPTVVFYGSDKSRIHLFEFVRYVSLLIEESLGTMLLHATASIHEDACYLVLGNKGAGKTTAMLHLVLDHGHSYFSGDKVLVSQNAAGVLLRGWPDYPHIGLGTLGRFANFAGACGVALTRPDGTARPSSDKALIDPFTFRRALPMTDRPSCHEAAALIFPRFSAGQTQVTAIAASDKNPDSLAAFVEHPHQFETVHWHRLFARTRRTSPADYGPLFKRLAQPPWLRVTGIGEIPPGSLTP